MTEHPLKTLVVVVPRGKGDIVTAFLAKKNIHVTGVMMGKGTAPKEHFGLGEIKKEVVLALGSNDAVRSALDSIEAELHLLSSLKGIAFTFDVNSISSGRVLRFCLNARED